MLAFINNKLLFKFGLNLWKNFKISDTSSFFISTGGYINLQAIGNTYEVGRIYHDTSGDIYEKQKYTDDILSGDIRLNLNYNIKQFNIGMNYNLNLSNKDLNNFVSINLMFNF